MFFKKILPQLDDNLKQQHIETPNLLQQKIISKIKAGNSLNVIADNNTGKTTSILISIINKLKVPKGDNPRALIFVKDKTSALDLDTKMKILAKGTNLRIYPIFEEQQIDKQKDAIYLGVDIVIGTPKRLSKLYTLNGLNLRELQMFVLEDAEFLETTSLHAEMIRISESLEKCQYLIFSSKSNKRIEKLIKSIQDRGQFIETIIFPNTNH
ncbi:MAG TPA: DEAD/DEAH box helicase [Crocinitomix sp.]|nr:DEAD/DEAH box helicase [Crocinitomix sp.]